MNFGERIRELRKARALTQRTLAEKLGVDFTYLSKIENGRLDQPPSEKLIRRMAEVLGAPPEELLDLSGQFDPKALQDVVADIPEAGVLLRRLQYRQLPRERIKQILRELQESYETDQE